MEHVKHVGAYRSTWSTWSTLRHMEALGLGGLAVCPKECRKLLLKLFDHPLFRAPTNIWREGLMNRGK
eukprot:1152208-Pelagomonas_calceolata.AAC.4